MDVHRLYSKKKRERWWPVIKYVLKTLNKDSSFSTVGLLRAFNMQGARVRSLVGELRSHSLGKNKTNKKPTLAK